MTLQAMFTLLVVALTVVALARESLSPDILLLGALTTLLVAGVLDPETALAGFANPALVTIGALFVVAAGLRATGVLDEAAERLLGGTGSLRGALGRLTGISALSSAFLNNTPVVAMGTPAVSSWARRRRIAASKLLIPLSYASILGGICTLIGTSTNLVSDGLLRAHGLGGLGFFELSAVGVPLVLIGIVYLTFLAPRLLPDRRALETTGDVLRRYLVEMELRSPSPLIGRTIEEAGLRRLPDLFLVRIERETGILSPVEPGERLRPGDHLTFAGVVETIMDLRKFRGLTAVGAVAPADGDTRWELHEAVISPGSPLVGTSIRRANFRARYNAAVVAVHRHAERIEGRLGDIVLRPGDTLLLEAAAGFSRAFRDSTDFYLVSRVDQSTRPRRHRTTRAIGVLAGVVLLAASGVLPIAVAALCGALGMVVLRCLSPGEARRSVDWSVLVMIGCALGVAGALEQSGAARFVAQGIVDVGRGFGPVGVLAATFLAAMLLTELVTNVAALALMFPIALAAAQSQGLEPRGFLIAATVAASLSLSTPLGYQTNLMVYGPGGYRFTDFLRTGLPLQLILATVAVTLIRTLWPL
ncbi:MAG: SLC13 family permease [Gemmatimonadota bacterium]